MLEAALHTKGYEFKTLASKGTSKPGERATGSNTVFKGFPGVIGMLYPPPHHFKQLVESRDHCNWSTLALQ